MIEPEGGVKLYQQIDMHLQKASFCKCRREPGLAGEGNKLNKMTVIQQCSLAYTSV